MKPSIPGFTNSRAGTAGLTFGLVVAFALVGARYANGAVIQAGPSTPQLTASSGSRSVSAASPTSAVAPKDRVPAPVPFGVGEVMEFKMNASALFIARGSGVASLKVEALDTVRGFPTYRLALTMKGSAVFGGIKVDNEDRSWLDVNDLFSHRFEQQHRENSKRDRIYDFFPATMRYQDLRFPADSGRLATPIPLDDISMLYYTRTLAMTATSPEMSQSRYYKADGNPIRLRVLKTERIKVPAGEFDAIVVQPIIRSKGLFDEKSNAQVWLSNDPRKLILRIQGKLGAASVKMELQSYTPGTPLSPSP